MKGIVWVPVLLLMAPLGLSAQDHRGHSVEAELPFAHLEAHLRTTAHLNHHQIQQYRELRGYGGDHGDHRHH